MFASAVAMTTCSTTRMAKLAVCFLLALCVARLEAYRYFQDRVPNGDRVPHPCKPNFLWAGLGHENVAGGGDRNPFGLDFAENGFKWDSCLCERDSDGDGKTNGEELGDPDCQWAEGAIPTRAEGLSHPGVCEPFDSPECMARNDWEFCNYDEFTCEATERPDVQELTFRFPNTSVPARETTYWCMTYDIEGLDPETDYHIIATKPLIDNQNIMHHIALMGCEPEPGDETWRLNTPTECGMAIQTCRKVLSIWTLGLSGECLPEEYGFRVGKTGFKSVLMQFHWTNPEKRADYMDGSGTTLFVTPHLRVNDAATLTVGTNYLTIPGGALSYTQEGYCHANCTSWLPHPVYFSTVLLHMHYLGRSGALEHIRGNDIMEITTEAQYSYDNPQIVRFDDPIEFGAGDEMKLTCNFKSTSRSGVTYYGDGTFDEMCVAFITYYPARPDFTTCMTYRSLDLCEMREGGDIEFVPIGGCKYQAFFAQSAVMMQEVDTACNATEKCPAGCQEVIDKYKEHPCLTGDVGIFTLIDIFARYYGDYGKNWVALFYSCEEWDRTIVFRERKDVSEVNDGNKTTETPTGEPSDGVCVFDVITAGVSASTLGNLVFVIMATIAAIFMC